MRQHVRRYKHVQRSVNVTVIGRRVVILYLNAIRYLPRARRTREAIRIRTTNMITTWVRTYDTVKWPQLCNGLLAWQLSGTIHVLLVPREKCMVSKRNLIHIATMVPYRGVMDFLTCRKTVGMINNVVLYNGSITLRVNGLRIHVRRWTTAVLFRRVLWFLRLINNACPQVGDGYVISTLLRTYQAMTLRARRRQLRANLRRHICQNHGLLRNKRRGLLFMISSRRINLLNRRARVVRMRQNNIVHLINRLPYLYRVFAMVNNRPHVNDLLQYRRRMASNKQHIRRVPKRRIMRQSLRVLARVHDVRIPRNRVRRSIIVQYHIIRHLRLRHTCLNATLRGN